MYDNTEVLKPILKRTGSCNNGLWRKKDKRRLNETRPVNLTTNTGPNTKSINKDLMFVQLNNSESV